MIFVAFGKGIDERAKKRRRRHGLTRNLHRHHYIFRVSSLKYPSIPVPIRHRTLGHNSNRLASRRRKQSVEKKAKPWMTWFLSLHRFILRLGLMKNLIKQRFLLECASTSFEGEHVLRVTEERRFVDVDDTKSYEVHSAHCRFTETLHQWKNEVKRQKVLMNRSCCDNLGFALRFRNEVTRGSANIDVASSFLDDGGQGESWQRLKIRFKGWHTEQSTPLHPM